MSFVDSKATPFLNVPLSTALFTVDTRDGLKVDNANGLYINEQSPYDINIYKNQQLFSGAVQRVSLTEINMPWNISNVNPRNNVLILRRSTDAPGTPSTNVVIISKFYTASELATAVQAQLNLGGGVFGITSWTCVFDSTDASFTIDSNNPAVLFRIEPTINKSKGSTTYVDGRTIVRTSTLAEMMGFNYVNTDFVQTIRGSYASMLYTTYVDVVSSVLCKNQEVRDTSTSYFTGNNILARIYISPSTFYAVGNDSTTIGTRPFMLHYKFDIPKEINWNPTEFLPSANIQLRDDKGDLLYAQNGFPFTVAPGSIEEAGNSGFVQLTFLISEAGQLGGNFTQFGR